MTLMGIILFNNETAKAALKKCQVTVMTQVVNGESYMAVPDTPRVRAILNNTKTKFDWSEAIVSDRLCF